MNAVVDTNVIAYFLLGTANFYEEAERFWIGVEGTLAPRHWQAELANVMWLACRSGQLAVGDAQRRLARAGRMPIRTMAIPALWTGALERSVRSGVAVYDTLFVELAARQGCRLATFDRQVLRAFPEIAWRPRDILDA